MAENQRQPIDAEVVDDQPGTAITPVSYPLAEGPAPGSTTGLAALKLEAKVAADLSAEFPPEAVEIKPDGAIYVPGGLVRDRLMRVFGAGNWALRAERDPQYDRETREVLWDGSLWIRGMFAARAIGGQTWYPGNAGQTKSDAIEAAKTDCLKRCCKDLGVALECWTPAFKRRWVEEYAIPCPGRDRQNRPKIYWLKKGEPIPLHLIDMINSAAGMFPEGMGRDTLVPDGPFAGKPFREASDEELARIASKASAGVFRLTAKAEIVCRVKDTQDAERAAADAPSSEEEDDAVSEVTGG